MPTSKTVTINFTDGSTVVVPNVFDCKADEAGHTITLVIDENVVSSFDVQ